MPKITALFIVAVFGLSACNSTVNHPLPGTVVGQSGTQAAHHAPAATASARTVGAAGSGVPAPSGTSARKPVQIQDAPEYSGSGTSHDPVIVDLYD